MNKLGKRGCPFLLLLRMIAINTSYSENEE